MKKYIFTIALFLCSCETGPMLCQPYGTGQVCTPAFFRPNPSTDSHPEIWISLLVISTVFIINKIRSKETK